MESHLDSRDSLSRWLVDFHNKVNERLGKPIMKYEEVAKEYVEANEYCSLAPSCQDEKLSSVKPLIQTSDKIMLAVGFLILILFLFKFLRK